MADEKTGAYVDLLLGAASGRFSRRAVLKRGLALGLSTPLLLSLLEACGSSSPGTATSGTDEGGTQPTASGSAAAGASPSAGSGKQSSNKQFVMVLTGGVPDVDPQSAYDNAASSLFFGTYEMLIRFKGSSTSEFVPMLAKSWDQNDEQTEYTFTFDPGIKFHDGSACDAQAVKDSFTRFLKMGRGPVNVISRFVQDPDKQMTVVDPTTLKFTMTQPQPLFLSAMASEYGPLIVSPTAMNAHKTNDDPYAHQWFSQNMVGTGPWKVTEASPQEKFVLDRFADFHGKPPFFDRVTVRVVTEDATRRQLIESGEVDGVAELPPDYYQEMAKNPALQIVKYDTTECDWVRMNYAKLSKEMRQGFCYAFPYDEVISQVLKGFAKEQGPIADTVIGFDSSIPVYKTDLDKAKQILQQAGVKSSDEFTYMYASGDASDASLAQLFQANLQQIGVKLTLQQVDRSALISLNYGDSPPEQRPHFTSSGWWPDYNDSWNQLYPNFHSDSVGSKGSNSSFYENKDFDAAMDQLKNAKTLDDIKQGTGKVVKILMWDDPAAIFYAQIIRAMNLRSDIKGFVPNGIYINSYNFNEMWREAT
ncbi:MAG TPA: ABC transporter substrate-binding protein [Thermomicrobiaceae bacterium]|nr:ABC transporter substrate-binding protein [Thermomicrobiaceae bacterium]